MNKYFYCTEDNLCIPYKICPVNKEHNIITLEQYCLNYISKNLYSELSDINNWQEIVKNTILNFNLEYGHLEYFWDKNNGKNTGTVKNLFYKDKKILGKDIFEKTHCSGYTFSMFIESINNYDNSVITDNDLRELKKYFYAQFSNQSGIGDGFLKFRIGNKYSSYSNKLKFSDFGQLYNSGKIGHALLVIKDNKTWGRKQINDGYIVYSSNSTTYGPGFDYFNLWDEKEIIAGRIE